MTRGVLLALLGLLPPIAVAAPAAPAAVLQDRAAEAEPPAPGPPAPDGALDEWRFPVGERMEYSVTWGGARIGRSELLVAGIDTIGGRPTYRTSLNTEGGPPFYRLEDHLTSWIQPEPFATVRFDQDLRQGGYRRNRRHLMDVERATYTRYDLEGDEWVAHEEEADIPIPAGALDEVAFFYFVRLSPLEVGKRYEYNRYFKESGNPVVLEVLRREEIRVPAGTFETIVVRPTIKSSGLFGEGGEAEIYVTDDERRIPVRLRTRMSIGTANFYLTDYHPGEAGVLIEEESGGADRGTEPPPDSRGGDP